MESLLQKKWFVALLALGLLALLLGLMAWVRPGVPTDIVIVAGPEGSRTHRWAERYAKYARVHSLRAQVVSTAGSGDVLTVLEGLDERAARRTVGFLQSGAEQTGHDVDAAADVQALGSLYFEPIWVIVGAESGISNVADLASARVYWGQPGSEAREAAEKLAQVYEIELPVEAELDAWTASEAAAALIKGEINAGIFVGTSDGVQTLLADDSLRPLSALHSEVFTRLHPEVGALRIPEGLFSLAKMVPREDIVVMAPTMNLVAHEGFHPALVDLFLDAATLFHSRATLFSEQGEFPGERYTSLAMNPDAVSYYKGGPKGLRKYLPFWVAAVIDQIINIGLPFIVVLSTVFKGIPVYLEWKLKLELMKFWKRLAAIEKDPQHDPEESLAQLDAIEAESSTLRTPGMHLPSYFELRQEIHDMRDRLKQGW
jgi:hypothetical protein